MWCPLCKTEYRDGYVECADCRMPLKSSLRSGRDEDSAALSDDMGDIMSDIRQELSRVRDVLEETHEVLSTIKKIAIFFCTLAIVSIVATVLYVI